MGPQIHLYEEHVKWYVQGNYHNTSQDFLICSYETKHVETGAHSIDWITISHELK